MKNKNFYVAMIISDGVKNYPMLQKFDIYDNIAHFFQNRRDIIAANILPTKREAVETVKYWRDSFKANGSYMFQGERAVTA